MKVNDAERDYAGPGQGGFISESSQLSSDVERTVRYQYDTVGNLVERKGEIEERFLNPEGKRSALWAVTLYEYDKNGNCIRRVSPKEYERENILRCPGPGGAGGRTG